MILRGVQVEHWCCIAKLDLGDLPAGVIVLHGPNRTGKSSVVRALRYCLFDADHDAGGKEFRKSIPWSGAGPPKVTVEFLTRGIEYRLTKIFSRKVDGKALLEKKVGSGWQIEEDAPKEASRKARELLGANKSTAGMNQLLWLEQGEIGLPDSSKLDNSLEERLVSVLGMLVTGRDLAFKQALDKRCSQWLTPGGKYAKDSPVSRSEQEKQRRFKIRDDEATKFAELGQVTRQLENCEDDLPRQQENVTKADEEFKQLDRERRNCCERVRQYAEASKDHQRALQSLQIAQTNLRNYEEAKKRCDDKEKQVREARTKVESAQRERDRLARQYEEKQRDLAAAREAEQTHQREHEEINDLRKLLGHAQLKDVLKKIQGLEDEIATLNGWIQNISAPDEQTLRELRENRRQAQALRAQLQASAWTLTVAVRRPLQIKLGLDGQPVEPIDLLPEESRAWTLRQKAAIDIPDVGGIEIGRMEGKLDLEQAARDLPELERQYQDVVRSYQEAPADEACLDRLTQRRIQRQTWANRLAEARQEIHDQAPEGRVAMETRLQNLKNQRKIILERSPSLTDWQPKLTEIEEREHQYNRRSTELQTIREDQEVAEVSAKEALQQAEAALQKQKEESAAALASAQASREELLRLGDEATHQASVEQGQHAVTNAERRLTECQLTEAEQSIEQRCSDAKTALETRQNRLRELQDDLNRLTGVLQGNEGLHTRLADAEAALQEAELALKRETLEAEAHRRLRNLFDDCRQSQIQQVMGPIAGRVLEWAKKVGLDDCREVQFGDDYFPEGIVLQTGGLDVQVTLADESYGTGEQLSLLVRLALGGVLAKDEPVVAILDDPLAHADPLKHRRILDILRMAAEGNPALNPPTGRLQILIFTCHPDRFDYLAGAHHIDLTKLIVRGP